MNLEEYIEKNRQEFDTENPDQRVWHRIESQLDNKHRSFPMLKFAAILLVFLITGFVVGNQLNQPEANEMAKMKDYQMSQSFLETQVNQKLVHLENKNLIDDEVRADLKSLDDVYQELKMELQNSNNANSDVIIHAMIENYRTKIKILEKILEKKSLEEDFEKIKKHTNESI